MNRLLKRPPVRGVRLCCSLVAIGCLAMLTGCQGDFSAGKWFTLKNPFARSETAKGASETAPPFEVAKPADVDRDRKQAPVVRAEARLPQRQPSATAHDGRRPPEANVAVHDDRKKSDLSRPDSAAEFNREMTRASDCERSGRFPEARTIYQRLMARYPDRYEPYHRLGVVADREKRFQEAQTLFTEAIHRNPTNADLHNDLGYCLYLQGRYQEAEAAIAHAIRLNAANPRYYNNLGMIYGHQRRYDEALEQFRHGGTEADAYYNLAFMLAAREDMEGAKKYFRLALHADPGYDQARQALDVLDRSGEDRQEPSGNTAHSQDRHEGARVGDRYQVGGRYDARPASLVTPVTSAAVSEQRDSTWIR